MRFTIERIRTLVLTATVLLVIAIGVFLGIAKFRRPFSRRDIPQRLGIDIQQEANGVTYTQAHGGHTLFKLHASRVVQLRNNHATLHDVVIELYGKDGARVDRIQGAEFEYDQSTSTATAAGTVEIEMQRPASTPQNGKPSKPSDDDAIRIRTSGVTFNQGTGIVTTAQHLQFVTQRGSGSATGATYDSDLGFLVLNSNFEMTTMHGSSPITLHAAHAEFNRDEQICNLRQATAQSPEEQATATEAQVTFRQDGSVDHLNATSGFTLSTQAGSHIAAPTGNMQFTTANEPRHAHLEGGVAMDSDSSGRTLHGTSPIMDLDFTAKGELHHAHLERGVEMHSQEQSSAGQLQRTWRSVIAEIDFRRNGSSQVEPATLHGTGGVVVSSETHRGNAAPVPSRLAADDVTAQFGPNSALTSMTGAGHAELDETSSTGAHEVATGDRLDAQFDSGASAAAKTAPQASSTGSQIQTAQLDGHVVLVDQPAAKPGTQQVPMRATAGHAFYDAASSSASPEQWLHLTINPRISDGGVDLTADKIDIAQTSGDAFAYGNIKAAWSNTISAGSTNSSQPPVTLGGNGPAHVIANEAVLHRATSEATFKGHGRLWQDQNSVSAPVLVLNRVQQTLVAEGSTSEPVVSVLLSQQGSPAARSQSGSASTPSVIRVRSGDLHYTAADRKAILRSAPLPAVSAQTGTVGSSSDQLEIYLVPVSAGSQRQATPSSAASTPSQVDHVIALGHVTLTSQGRHGTGSQLVYTAQTSSYVLTGTAATPPRMTDPERGAVTGQSLIFNSRDDSVSIEGGTQQTMTQTTAPR